MSCPCAGHGQCCASSMMSVLPVYTPAALPTHQTPCFQPFSCAALLIQQAAGHDGPRAAPPPGDHPAQWSAAGTGGVPAWASRHPPAPHRPRLPAGACQVGSWRWFGMCWEGCCGVRCRWKAMEGVGSHAVGRRADGGHGQPCCACSSCLSCRSDAHEYFESGHAAGKIVIKVARAP